MKVVDPVPLIDRDAPVREVGLVFDVDVNRNIIKHDGNYFRFSWAAHAYVKEPRLCEADLARSDLEFAELYKAKS